MANQQFEDFDLTVERVGDLYRTRVIASQVGEVLGTPFSLSVLTVETGGRTLEPEVARGLGTRLFEAAFSGEVRKAFIRSRQHADERGRGLRLRLRLSSVPELATLPWELLYSPSEGGFLSLRVPIVRYVETRKPGPISREPGPLRVLTVLDPLKRSFRNAEWEWGGLRQRLESSVPHGQLVLDHLSAATPEALYKRLQQEDFHVLHFAGHDRYEGAGAAGMDLEPFGIKELSGVLRDNPVGLVVLNAARTATPAKLVEPLIQQGVSTIVDLPLHKATGARFNTELYRGLAEGVTVDTAVSNARQTLYLGNSGSDWGAPAVYTSLPTGHSFGIPEYGGGFRETTRSIRSPERSISFGGIAAKPTGGEPSGGEDVPPPPPPPSSAPFLPPQPQIRFLQGRFPTRVRLADTATLQVRIALAPGKERNAPLREIVVPAEGLDAMLVVYARGFEVLEGDHRPVKIPFSADSDWVPFTLKAARTGIHDLDVTAYTKDGAFLGSLSLEVTVDEYLPTGESHNYQQPLRRRLAEDEITLTIRYDDVNRIYRFQLGLQMRDGKPVPLDEVPGQRLQQTPVDAVESLVRGLNEIAKGYSKFTAEQSRIWLRNKGIDLWQSFIPQELQRQFWNLQGRIKKILIVSDIQGDPVPWELLYPFQRGTSNDAGFLAEQFLVSRWVSPADPPASQLHLGNAAFVEPRTGSPLPQAEQEINNIRGLMRQRGIGTGNPVGDLTSLLDLLNAGGFNLLHFACHNSYKSAEISMGGSPFQPVFLREHQGRYASAAPLVFINACRSDVQMPSYTSLEGWARAFLATGVGAFIGTLWEVRDETAAQFAEEFYRSLLGTGPMETGPKTLGEALMAARKAVRDVPGDPTWLAYTLYGDTAAAVV